MKKISQIVDTLKLHFYHPPQARRRDVGSYGSFVEEIKSLKAEAMNNHHSNNEMRSVPFEIGGQKFRVLPNTISGFSCTIKNMDVSISFKSMKKEGVNYNSDDFMELPPNPICKVEFRASFLARVGHESATRYIVKLFENHILEDFVIKVSEIHLATDIQGYKFTMLDFHRFRTTKRNNKIYDEDGSVNGYYYSGRKFTGFSFGSGDEMIRIYNKTVEVSKNPDKAFVVPLVWERNSDYDSNKEVWRIEIQFRRAVLKTLFCNGRMDDLDVLFENIQSLWAKGLDSVVFTSLSDNFCLESFLGYSLEDGNKIPIKHNTILMRIKRALVHPLWDIIRSWFGYVAEEVNVYYAPKTASFQWVSNSIKSFFSTLLKYNGDISRDAILESFVRAEEELIEEKKITLVDNAYLKALRYLGSVEKDEVRLGVAVNHYTYADSGVHSNHRTLRENVHSYISKIADNVFLPTERCSKMNKHLMASYA